jgi:regulator of sirC expression with transglutaminase-like and TPR domain
MPPSLTSVSCDALLARTKRKGADVPDDSKLSALLKLIDDESSFVRETVSHELLKFGPQLEDELAKNIYSVSPQQKTLLEKIFRVHRRVWLREIWPTWFDIKNDKDKLETALAWISEFQHGRHYEPNLKSLLDHLAAAYSEIQKEPDPFSLAEFLFVTQELRGTQSKFYEPSNSNLVDVIQKRKGIPISLSCIYILVGHRLGLAIEGCNAPTHFLARFDYQDEIFLVDCFNRGAIHRVSDWADLKVSFPNLTHEVIAQVPGAEAIISRVLRNLIRAYQESNDVDHEEFMQVLLFELEKNFS